MKSNSLLHNKNNFYTLL